jgi:hypothetical protein
MGGAARLCQWLLPIRTIEGTGGQITTVNVASARRALTALIMIDAELRARE